MERHIWRGRYREIQRWRERWRYREIEMEI